MTSKIWDDITYPFTNPNGVTVEVREYIGDFIPHIVVGEIIYPC